MSIIAESDVKIKSVLEGLKGRFYLSTDSEWDGVSEEWLSTVIESDAGKVIYNTTKDVDDANRSLMEVTAIEAGAKPVFIEKDDATDLLADYWGQVGIIDPPSEVYMLNFWSPKDIEHVCSWNAVNLAIEGDTYRQKKNLSGHIYAGGVKVHVRDISGWRAKGSLAQFGSSLGVNMGSKNTMDQYKANMRKGMTERPEDYIRYSVNDVTVLKEIHDRFIELIRTIQGECLGLSGDDLWDDETIPMTTGKLTAVTLERWILSLAEDRVALKFALRKLGVLNPDDWSYKKSLVSLIEMQKTIHSMADFQRAKEYPSELFNHFFRAKFRNTAMNVGSVKCWAGRSEDDSAAYNALVQGGRCNSEDPFHYRIEKGADIDIVGCYGEALRSTIYPLGIPRVWGRTPNQEHTTFGEWLDDEGDDLAPGLWSAVVSGTLSYDQDLILSKMCKYSDIKSGGQDDGKIASDYAMLRREIVNGIITSDLLDLIRKTASNAEWKEIRNLKLVTAVGYRASERMDDIDAWVSAVISSRGKYIMTDDGIRDTRTNAWCAIHLEGFLGKLIDRRKDYQRLIKKASTDEERTNAKGMSETLKLFVNTTYGVLASPYFDVGNTVVANNITARARMGVWMMSKALGIKQTITDGGVYLPHAVNHFDPTSKKPGLSNLSRLWEWHSPKRQRWVRPMPGAPDWDRPMATEDARPGGGMWDIDAQDCHDEWDAAAASHIQRFWEPYGVVFPFRVGHKCLVEKGSFWSKADYAFVWQGESKVRYKLRGKHQDGRAHPMYEVLGNIIDDKDTMPEDMVYDKKNILKIKKFKLIQASNGYKDLKDLRPGDSYTSEQVARLNNIWMPLSTEKDFLARKTRKKKVRREEVEWFERYRHEGIESVHNHMVKNDLKTQPELTLV